MRNSKKAIVNSIVFILLFSLVAAVIVFPANLNGSEYNDSGKRRELSGSLDFLFVGASMSVAGFIPEDFDHITGYSSYNLSGDAASLSGRYALIEKEILRNDIDTVVLEISYGVLSEDIESVNATGEPRTIFKLDSFGEKISYFFNNVSLFNNDYENVLSVSMRYGLKAWSDILHGRLGKLQNNKGFRLDAALDVTLDENNIIAKYNELKNEFSFREDNIEKLESIIDLCHHKGVDVIIITMPVADAYIWRYANLDEFDRMMNEIADRNRCAYYDFNLVVDRYERFSDEESYNNLNHLSETGARQFTESFSEIMFKVKHGEDVSDLFYDSYEEMKQDSPYMEYYLAHKDEQ